MTSKHAEESSHIASQRFVSAAVRDVTNACLKPSRCRLDRASSMPVNLLIWCLAIRRQYLSKSPSDEFAPGMLRRASLGPWDSQRLRWASSGGDTPATSAAWRRPASRNPRLSTSTPSRSQMTASIIRHYQRPYARSTATDRLDRTGRFCVRSLVDPPSSPSAGR